eukprot:TRINITY_DN294_c0_g1_i1.p1 TRINITY_DN294_c0_g1~~TRINITY_DN294_c0_g1_i1.p1  ORF type:complete len:967 (+),score=277.72 TRINITY_DN294_c0_g1_i1:83-2902(+)
MAHFGLQDRDFASQSASKLEERSGSFVSFFLDLPVDETVFRIFDRKGYYSVHGENAKFIAQEYFRTTVVLKNIGGSARSIPSVCLSQNMFEDVVKDLLMEKRCVVELWASEGGQKWKRSKLASPGNLQDFEDFWLNQDDYSGEDAIVLAIRVATRDGSPLIGVAHASSTQRSIALCEFSDADDFSNLQSVIYQCGAHECVVMAKDRSKSFDLALAQCDVRVTEVKKNLFESDGIEHDLERILREKQEAVLHQVRDSKHAMSALASVVKYLGLLDDSSNKNTFCISVHRMEQFVHIDPVAVTALNVLPSPADASKSMSLFGLLNQCRTSMGSRKLNRWTRQPLISKKEIDRRLDLVESFVEDAPLRLHLLNDALRKIPDLTRISKKLLRGVAKLEDCVKLYEFVMRIPSLINSIAGFSGPDRLRARIETDILHPFEESQKDFENLVVMIENTIDFSESDSHSYRISPAFDPELQRVREEMDEVLRGIHDAHMDVCKRLGIDHSKNQLKLEQNSVHGYSLRLSRKDEKLIRNKHEFVVLDTRKDGVVFTTVRIRKMSDEWSTMSSEYDAKQSELVKKAVEVVSSYVPVIDRVGELISDLDVFVSFAHVSSTAPKQYVRPVMFDEKDCDGGDMNEEGVEKTRDLRLVESRHPCLEAQDSCMFVANDAVLESGKSTFCIITGPNMGGKSTYIRQVALISLMAHMGCFVPCSAAEIPIIDAIFARIGASDSQLRGVSTFMAEMLEVASILRTATYRSLVIVDELGRGTSTYDGFGLAYAIAEHILTKIHCFCMFATHFHELTSLDEDHPDVRNLHVSARMENERLVMEYRVLDGKCDQSFGIHVAEMVDFPKEVVEVARKKARELEDLSGENDFKKRKIADVDSGAIKSSSEEDENTDALFEAFLQATDPGVGVEEQKEQLRRIQDKIKNFESKNDDAKIIVER